VKPTLDKLRSGSSIMDVDSEEGGEDAEPHAAAAEVWQDATDKLELALKQQLLQDMAMQSAWQLDAYAVQPPDGDDAAAAASTQAV
jgi:DNA-binding IscR family transcriptional regulator